MVQNYCNALKVTSVAYSRERNIPASLASHIDGRHVDTGFTGKAVYGGPDIRKMKPPLLCVGQFLRR
jgi:hypothetical protein